MSCMSPGSVEPDATADSFRCSTKVARAALTLVSSEASASAPRPYSLSCLLAVASFISSAMIDLSWVAVSFMWVFVFLPSWGSSICIVEDGGVLEFVSARVGAGV